MVSRSLRMLSELHWNRTATVTIESDWAAIYLLLISTVEGDRRQKCLFPKMMWIIYDEKLNVSQNNYYIINLDKVFSQSNS